MSDKYDSLRLEKQLCFPLYACAKEIIKKYKPYLDKLNLTYTQYITMMVFWEYKKMNVKELGQKLYLDSGTLTPLLKKLEAKKLITRERSKDDERNLIVKITEEGESLIEKAKNIPEKISCCVNLSNQEAEILYKVLYKILAKISD